MSDGEIGRTFERYDKRMDGFVTIDAWTAENDRMKERINTADQASRERDQALEEAAEQRAEHGRMTRGQLTVVLIGVASVAATVVGAYISAKGIK